MMKMKFIFAVPSGVDSLPDFCAFLSDISKLEGHFCDLPEKADKLDASVDDRSHKLAYIVTDVPPWYLCILLGTQVWQKVSLRV